jgi:hypothetical protein
VVSDRELKDPTHGLARLHVIPAQRPGAGRRAGPAPSWSAGLRFPAAEQGPAQGVSVLQPRLPGGGALGQPRRLTPLVAAWDRI